MIKPSCLQQYHKIPVIVPPVISPPGYKPIKSETDFSFRLQAPAPPPPSGYKLIYFCYYFFHSFRYEVGCMYACNM